MFNVLNALRRIGASISLFLHFECKRANHLLGTIDYFVDLQACLRLDHRQCLKQLYRVHCRLEQIAVLLLHEPILAATTRILANLELIERFVHKTTFALLVNCREHVFVFHRGRLPAVHDVQQFLECLVRISFVVQRIHAAIVKQFE